ncbi:unnamed protein product [Linum tenue]|uniref:Uncharacterized protein n=1 Tax=Linum tenue TaxID=586396 RepID=A0AAV0PX88_9ROSI|nr:unnamed protein product [Linum tenue]
MSADEDAAADAVLSDVEEEDDPIPIAIPSPSQELEQERALRQAAEDSKSELQDKFLRLKSLAHEAIKKRDECSKQRDQGAKEKDEVMTQRDEFAGQLDEAVKVRDGLLSEMENSRHMLVSGIEKISGKVSSFKNFAAAGLPRSQKYSGFPAVAYGVIKRTNEIVEELVRQIDATAKSRNEAREQIEQRNYAIAIEVSQLEATIDRLREELEKKSSSVERLEKAVADNNGKLLEVERQLLSEKIQMEEKMRKLEAEMESLRPLLVDQLNLVSQIRDQLCDVIKTVDSNHSDSDLSESLFLPQQTGIGENVRASVAGTESIHELTRIVLEKAKDWAAEKMYQVKKLNETVDQLNKEKEQISSLLRSALSKRMALDPASKTNELFQAAENGLRDSGIDFKFNKVLAAPHGNNRPSNAEEDEIYSLVIVCLVIM